MRMSRIILIVILCFAGVNTAMPQPPDTLWTYTYSSSVNDVANTIAFTPDGGFVVGGEGRNPDSTDGSLLIRLDSAGHQVWIRHYEEFSSGINDIVTMEDGGFAITGGCATNSGMMVVRTDSVGEVQWSHYIYADWETGWKITKTTDGGVAALGVDPLLPFKLFLVRLSSNGDSLWKQSFDNSMNYIAGDVVATTDSGFLVGSTNNWQTFAAKISSGGAIEWSNTYSTDTLLEYAHGIAALPNGDYVTAGARERGLLSYNPYASRVTALGDTVWTHVFADLGPGHFYSVCVLPDSNIVLCGYGYVNNRYNYLVVLVSPEGDLIWSTFYDSDMDGTVKAICLTDNNGIAMAGHRHPHLINADDIWVIRTASLLSESVTPFEPVSSLRLFTNYPNPFNSTTQIEFILPVTQRVSLRLYNVLGREVAVLVNEIKTAGEHRVTFDAAGLASGVYLCRMEAGEFAQTRKMILLK